MVLDHSSTLRFDGRVVVVTGAGVGLGRAYALLFGSRGARVVVNDLGSSIQGDGNNNKIADIVVEEIKKNGGKAVANYDNVLEGDKIIKTAINTFGRIDIVVNNAGILRDKTFQKMTDSDWDIIHDVHLKGSMKTTKAAWPYFCKQNFGKVILTSSHSGLYGNFGQANYSAAKMGLVGFAKTLAIEGEKKNIYTNVIVPIAGSRLTENIFPPDLFEQLKPEYIAPIVVWLCHDFCQENGSIIESSAGWAGKCELIRSSGYILRQNVNDAVTPEAVRNNWMNIIDMSNTKTCGSIQEITGELMTTVEQLHVGNLISNKGITIKTNYQSRDAILYALGVGATIKECHDIQYLYENHENFSLMPTFYTTFGPIAMITTSLLQDAIPGIQLDPSRILHGEEYLEIHTKLPTEGKVESRFKVIDILDKGKGTIILVQYETYDVITGIKLTTHQTSIFIIGTKGLGSRNSSHVIPCIDPPKQQPCYSVTQKTHPDQAALYRLSGDYNPLHIDNNISTMAGFSQPILHGLCFLGFSIRHILQTFADGNPELLKTLKVRFTKSVIPGQTLCTDMWRNGNRIHFQTSVVENNTNVITGAYVDLKEIKISSIKLNLSISRNLESDIIFAQIADYIKTHQEKVKIINGIFHYIVTKNGKPYKDWTLDLKKCAVYKEKPNGMVDATLTIDEEDLIQMTLGKLSSQRAFMQGKLKIKGNIMLTQKLKSLIDATKPKL